MSPRPMRSFDVAVMGAILGALAAVLLVRFGLGDQADNLTPVRLFLIIAVGLSGGFFISIGGIQYSFRCFLHFLVSQIKELEQQGLVPYLMALSRSPFLQLVWWLIVGHLIGWVLLTIVRSTPLTHVLGAVAPSSREVPFAIAGLLIIGPVFGLALYWWFHFQQKLCDGGNSATVVRRALNAGWQIPLAVLVGYLIGMVNLWVLTLMEGPVIHLGQSGYREVFGAAGGLMGLGAGVIWVALGR